MSSWVKAAFGLGASVMLVVGCGEGTTGDAGGTGGVAPIPFDQLADEMVSVYCGALSGCCSRVGYPYDGAACRTTLGGLFASTSPDPSRVVYDAVAAGACVQALRNQLASCGEPDGGPVCDGVFRGLVAAGDACTSDVECADDGAECDGGACVVMPRATLGSPCSDTCVEDAFGSRCTSFGGSGTCYRNDGFYCSSPSETCQPVIPAGGACSEYESCGIGLICRYGEAGGVCSPRLPLGAACLNSDDCAQGFCDSETGVCAVRRAGGQPCQASEECQSGACDYDTGLCTAGGDGGEFANPSVCAGDLRP